MGDRVLTADRGERENLAAFLARAVRLDEAAVVRLRQRDDTHLVAWAATGFEALAARVVAGLIRPQDTVVAADGLLGALHAGDEVDPGYAMDSAWRGALPPDEGYVHVDDVPAAALIELARQGAEVAAEHGGPKGPPASLLAQEVLAVDGGGEHVVVSMRTVFALAAMGFVPGADTETAAVDPAELVRVRASRTWLRLDARYGSVFARRGGEIPISVL
ncbi:hypothetical protein FK531_07635 [Rhodococcus spelaei]|uniref:Uncharacterized protein n=1 Tax=Rhodococcus spelaei TaxID=2546320 RepID=A0A541BM32_9NOCA|nr:hypothetical protein [Rhodococcus spelaei]TQF73371.1 hypothetical protein FK531_07635 [Rhodococcus spelaei]